jgi:hypothetical protein
VKVAVDIDGTADADPAMYRGLMGGLRKAGHKVIVLTGCHHDPITDECKAAKKADLQRLGLADCYDKLKVYPNPPGKAKAAYCAKHDVSLMIDNNVGTAQLARDICTVLVPWSTLQP